MVMRNSIRMQISIGAMVVVVVLFLSPWFGGSLFAQEAVKSQAAIEKTFPSSSKCKR